MYFDKIFEFFKRLHNSTRYNGTGIGLGICKKIIENYEGQIMVDSKIDEGTTFTIQIPITQEKIRPFPKEQKLELTNS